jgi:MerR family transcriptional regulator, light-induced transcriptional regulator
MQRTEVRIGELSRRTGVGIEALRAWERRYGLLRPARSAGGFRLYSPDDERRVRLMQSHLDRGLAAAEAARAALSDGEAATAAAPTALLEAERERLGRALDGLDETAAHAALDSLFAGFTLETVLAGAVLPYLASVGDRWERGEATVAQEHFASSVLRGRLLALTRNWDRGAGPRAVLACAPGDTHDLALIAFGLALAGRGWRITYLGPDTPVESLTDAGAMVQPEAVVVAATLPGRLEPAGEVLRRIGRTTRLYVAGPGATEALARQVGATLLEADPVAAAAALTY